MFDEPENLNEKETTIENLTSTESKNENVPAQTEENKAENVEISNKDADDGKEDDEQVVAVDKNFKKHLAIVGLTVEPPDIYLENGVHIGSKFKTNDMRQYIYRIKTAKTPKGWIKISVFDVAKIDKKIKLAAKFLSSYTPSDVVVISNGLYGRKPASMFAKYCGFKFVDGRFDSGTLTNPNSKKYVKPEIIFITNPAEDKQAIKEAVEEHLPVIVFANSNTRLKNIDFAIPGNNVGKYSIAMLYWLLTKEISKIKNFEFNVPVPRATAVNAEGKEIPNEFVSTEEPSDYLLVMREINKALKRKRRNKKGSIKIKHKIVIR
ncbi:MAG: 30S ribosomal protein S2 [Candidatus Altarchaeum sp.]|nr:30S ribosomal protein S2 [Candidatus Altarchaeum sp.]